MKKTDAILVSQLLFGKTLVMGAVPTITTFSPASGAVGSSVTISGTGFSATPAQNIVFFGATQATVSTVTTTSLTVTVPGGSTDQYISVTNLATNLTAYSAMPFIVTLAGNINFTDKQDIATGTNPFSVAIGDLDGDGKPDLAVANSSSDKVSVLRNTSTSGSISFAGKVDYATGSSPHSVCIGDIDGDGKPDLALANNAGTLTVYRNISSSGSFSFDSRVDFTAGSNPWSVSIGDLDGDGKPDLVTANQNGNSISILKQLAYAWTGTNSVPIASDNVTIPDVARDPIIGAASLTVEACNSLTIETGAVLTISAGKALTVNRNLINSAGTTGLVIKSDGTGTGSLKILGSTSASATVERIMAPNKWHIVSAPAMEDLSTFLTRN